jgi:DNA-binding ferritin-like protein
MSDNVLFNALHEQIVASAAKANAIADRIRAARAGNPESTAKKFVTKAELSEVPEEVRATVEKFREGRDKVLASLAANEAKAIAAVVATLPKSELSEEETAAQTAEYKSHVEKFRTWRKSLVDLDVATEEQLSELPKVKTLGGGSSAGTHASSGRPKPRFDEITLNGQSVAKTVDGKRVCTPTVLSERINALHADDEKWNKVTSHEIVDEVFATNGSQDLTEPVTITSFRGEYALVFTPKAPK